MSNRKASRVEGVETMSRRDFLKSAGTGALALALGGGLPSIVGAAAASKPNIIVILADDLGYAELGVQGCKDTPTPYIDSIARNGVRFTSGYVSCPACSPTRAGLLTGRYQQRFGHEFNPAEPPKPTAGMGLAVSETTIADRLKKLGYATAAFGKWHLGYEPEFLPQRRGFDEFFGFLGGYHDYLSAAKDPNNPLLRGTKPVDKIDYTTDAFAREAVEFIERNADKPFFLYLPFNAVHCAARVDSEVPGPVQVHQGREAPHVLRDELGHGRWGRADTGETAREEA